MYSDSEEPGTRLAILQMNADKMKLKQARGTVPFILFTSAIISSTKGALLGFTYEV